MGTDDVTDPTVFEHMNPPLLAKKGGALARIGCTADGFPKEKPDSFENQLHDEVTSQDDLKRARSKVPRASHRGNHFANMSEKLNGFVKRYSNTRECNEWKAKELQQ